MWFPYIKLPMKTSSEIWMNIDELCKSKTGYSAQKNIGQEKSEWWKVGITEWRQTEFLFGYWIALGLMIWCSFFLVILKQNWIMNKMCTCIQKHIFTIYLMVTPHGIFTVNKLRSNEVATDIFSHTVTHSNFYMIKKYEVKTFF